MSSMDENEILIKPHHFVDILAAFGEGQLSYSPHPYGHALHVAARRILEQRDAQLHLTTEADAICAPCRYNRDGRCADAMPTRYAGFPRVPSGKQEWNSLIDTRWCRELEIRPGDTFPAAELCRRVWAIRRRLPRIYCELPRRLVSDLRQRLGKGITLFLEAGRDIRKDSGRHS
jgi:hypothetical protein